MGTIHTQYNIVNKKTGFSFVLNDHATDPDNFIALQSYPTFNLDIRANELQFSGSHGAYKLPSFYGGRSIIFSGVIVGESEAKVWETKKNIDRVFSLGTGSIYDELVTISFTDPNGVALSLDATLNSSINYSRNLKEPNILNFQIMLRSRNVYFNVNDPVFDSTIYTGSLSGTVSLFRIPFSIPFLLSNTTATTLNITTVNSSKTEITLYGSNDEDIVNPTIKNITTGKETRFIFTIPKGSQNFIKIDGLTGKIIDQDGSDLSVYVENGGYIELVVGLNKFVYTSEKNDEGLYPNAIFKITAKQYII